MPTLTKAKNGKTGTQTSKRSIMREIPVKNVRKTVKLRATKEVPASRKGGTKLRAPLSAARKTPSKPHLMKSAGHKHGIAKRSLPKHKRETNRPNLEALHERSLAFD